MEVHEKIKVMRLFKGFTQQGMADELGYESVHGYAKLERGETDPTLGKLKEITTVLGITLQDLLGLNQANIVNIAEHSLNNSNGSQNITLLSESQCANELEKSRLLLHERDKEVELLKVQIAQLQEMNALLKNKIGD
jgi:transcriptional regulator with XRE-family HTH domain